MDFDDFDEFGNFIGVPEEPQRAPSPPEQLSSRQQQDEVMALTTVAAPDTSDQVRADLSYFDLTRISTDRSRSDKTFY